MTLFRCSNSICFNTSLTLAFGLLGFTLLSMLLVFYFILSPMANRAADDMGGLMHIVSKSWFALPVDKKQEFQSHLREQHQLFITDDKIQVTEIKSSYPFIPRLEKALFHHTGQVISVKQADDDGDFFWVVIPQATQKVNVGFLHERLGPHPSKAIMGILLIGCILILVTTILLVRRITHPITTLSNAVNLLGSGKLSTRIPETGAKELVVLAHNFNQMAQEINQLLTNRNILFGGISHDLRTPITRMQIALELLEDNDSVLISGMRNDLNEMETLIQQTLELIKGMDKHHAKAVGINKVISEIVIDYQRQHQLIQWKKSDCDVCKIEVHAFRRVLCNILDNAFRYGSDQPVELSCSKENNKLFINILDQGPGIPLDKLEAVFQPFYRLDNSRNKKTGGSGLGLAIVRQLCDIHDWKIQLLCQEKKGLEVRIEIPDVTEVI